MTILHVYFIPFLRCLEKGATIKLLTQRALRTSQVSISYLLRMNLARKLLQYPGDAHLAAAYRVLAYVKGTSNQGLSYHDPGGKRNKLSGWVDRAILPLM